MFVFVKNRVGVKVYWDGTGWDRLSLECVNYTHDPRKAHVMKSQQEVDAARHLWRGLKQYELERL